MLTRRLLPLAVAVFASLTVGACGGTANVARSPDQCSEQIILSLAPGFDRTDRVIKDLSRGADVRLEYLRSASQTLHVYKLTAQGKDPGCRNALVRLRQDSHVRIAELDGRRTHFDAAN